MMAAKKHAYAEILNIIRLLYHSGVHIEIIWNEIEILFFLYRTRVSHLLHNGKSRFPRL